MRRVTRFFIPVMSLPFEESCSKTQLLAIQKKRKLIRNKVSFDSSLGDEIQEINIFILVTPKPTCKLQRLRGANTDFLHSDTVCIVTNSGGSGDVHGC